MRTFRLLAILDHLRACRQPVSAQKLADTFGVSLRTMYRDMEALQSMGAPVRGESGLGYQIEKGFFLPPLHFDSDELDAVLLGMQLVSARGDETLAQAAMRASSKINAVLLESQREQYSARPFLAYSSFKEEASDGNLPLVRESIRKRLKLRIVYKDLKEAVSQRLIRPLGVTVFDKVWLLTAWCEAKKDFRNFRLDRMSEAVMTDMYFLRESGKEFSDYIRTL